jgi:hypothetical protein
MSPLGIEHGNILIQLDLWGNEVIFMGKGQTTIYGYPRPDQLTGNLISTIHF